MAQPPRENGSEAAPVSGRVACLVRQHAFTNGEDSNNVLEVCEEGLRLLESLGPEPIAVIAVAGMYRTGKSTLLNWLAGDGNVELGFGVGETTEACTRGVWVCCPAGLTSEDGSRVVLVDTEGLSGPDATDTYDATIFALGLLLSSYFVLNVVGVIDDATIERLHLVSQVVKQIVVSSSSANDDNNGHHSKGDKQAPTTATPSADDDDDLDNLSSASTAHVTKARALAEHLPPLVVSTRGVLVLAENTAR